MKVSDRITAPHYSRSSPAVSDPTADFDYRHFLKSLPELPGVYRMIDKGGKVLYVGKAKILRKRVSSYFQRTLSSPRIALMVSQIANIETTVTRSEAEALLLENNLIKRLLPKYNIVFRDDKSYPYIQITREGFPRITFFRGSPDRKADYFGPYPSASAVRNSLHALQKMFRLRTCEDSVFANRSRACLLYQIRRCSGPCVGHVSAQQYIEDVDMARLFLGGQAQDLMRQLAAKMEGASQSLAFERAAELRDQIQMLGQLRSRQYVTGLASEDCDIIAGLIRHGQMCIMLAMVRSGEHLGDKALFPQHAEQWEIADAVSDFLRQHYAVHPFPARIICNIEIIGDCADDLRLLAGRDIPLALPRGDQQRSWVEMAEKNGELALSARRSTSAAQAERLEALREVLQLEDLPLRIECFDISHTQGEAPVASCVVCENGAMKSADYRRFNIRDVTPGDDYAAIAQAVRRRYEGLASDQGIPPSLIIIDGGAGQVAAAHASMVEIGFQELPMIGVSKGEGRLVGAEKIVFPDRRLPLQLSLDHRGFQLLLEVRDEAHRFAVAGHRSRRAKPRKESQLESIEGIGGQRRKQLIAHFGSIAGVREATIEQISSIPGIGRKLAEHIYQALH